MSLISFPIDSSNVTNRDFSRALGATIPISGGTRYQKLLTYQVPQNKKALFSPNLSMVIQRLSPLEIENVECFSCTDFLNSGDSVIVGIQLDSTSSNTYRLFYIVNSANRYFYETTVAYGFSGTLELMSVTYSAIELDK